MFYNTFDNSSILRLAILTWQVYLQLPTDNPAYDV